MEDTMIELNSGANGEAQDPSPQSAADIQAALAAQVQAFKSGQAADKATVPAAESAQAETQPQESAQAPAPKKPDPLQPFRNKEGEIDPQRIEKANESLKKETETREERVQRLLRENKELQRGFTKTSQHLRSLEKEVEPQPVVKEADLRKQLLNDLEKDPVETLLKIVDSATKPLKEKLSQWESGQQNRRLAESIDDLGQAGHPWVYTPEGQQWFNDRFQEEPGLLSLSNPHAAAVKLFADKVPSQNARQPGQAQPARGTPILGASAAVPPPSSAPAATPEKKLEALATAMNDALQVGDIVEANKIRSEMRKLHIKIF